MVENMEEKAKVPIAFKGTEEYRERLQRAALDRKMKVQALIETALEDYLTPSDLKPAAKVPSGEHHRLLDVIYREGTENEKAGILQNLISFVAAIRARKQQPPPSNEIPMSEESLKNIGKLVTKELTKGKSSRRSA